MKCISVYFKIILIYICSIIIVYAEERVPIDITSDEMQWNDNDRIAYAIGNASAIQGKRKLQADELIVYLEKNNDTNEIILIKAEGNVIFTNMDEIATGKLATYDFIKNNIIIEDEVTLMKNDNLMKGELLEMNLNTGISQISSKNDSNKVKMRFLPKTSDEDIK
jgi:lipopolysaccharide export system protein LptA